MTLSAGSLLKHGQYRIDEVLACGGFGIVYRAIQTDLGLPIVLKTLKAEEPALPLETLKERFLTEARRLMHLRHRHIVQVRDCFMEDGHPFMVMDFIPGFTLAQKIANGPLPAAEALRYIRQIGQALSFIHAQGLLHRDVKPSNIIVDERTQQAILIDFGIARELSPQAPQPNTGILSVGFAALEQYLPAHRWTAATDVYGLAATLYALITGQTPESSVVREQVGLREPHELNPNSSPSLNQAILKGMALEVTQRPASIDAWLALLPEDDSWIGNKGQSSQEPITDRLPQRETVPVPIPSSSDQDSMAPSNSTRRRALAPKKANPTKRKQPPAKPSHTHRLKIALGWTAVVAALGGASAGLFVKTQLLVPAVPPNKAASPVEPQPTIQEEFAPKARPVLPYDDQPTTPATEPSPTLPDSEASSSPDTDTNDDLTAPAQTQQDSPPSSDGPSDRSAPYSSDLAPTSEVPTSSSGAGSTESSRLREPATPLPAPENSSIDPLAPSPETESTTPPDASTLP